MSNTHNVHYLPTSVCFPLHDPIGQHHCPPISPSAHLSFILDSSSSTTPHSQESDHQALPYFTIYVVIKPLYHSQFRLIISYLNYCNCLLIGFSVFEYSLFMLTKLIP